MYFILRSRMMSLIVAAFLILGYLPTGTAFAQTAVSADAPKITKPEYKLPAGLLEMEGFKYPVYLYSPDGLEASKKYPLIFMIPSETDSPEKQIEYILATAKSLKCFVLIPYNTWPQDTPYEIDRWLLQVKNEIIARFPIDTAKVYAIGRNSGGQYASYLITAYPNEFSGAALIGEAWEGPFVQLLKPRKNVSQQMPVVAAFATDQTDKKTKNEKWILEYQALGYPVQMMTPPEGQTLDSDEFKVALLEWLDQKSRAWKLIRDEKSKSLRERLRKGVIDFFAV